MSVEIQPLKAFDDNYIWLIRKASSTTCVVIDPGDEEPVIEALKAQGLTLEAILITHKHGDHTGGVTALVNETGATVYGPAQEPLPFAATLLSEDQHIHLKASDLTFTVIEVPGHTLGHIAYYGHDSLFCGDVLFSGGCGRVFEGTMQQMYSSLQKLQKLPSTTAVYCAHEYTESNLKFAQTVEPTNQNLADYSHKVNQLRNEGLPTIPTQLDLEIEVNPFLRCDQPSVIQAAQHYQNERIEDPIAVFSALRSWKNRF